MFKRCHAALGRSSDAAARKAKFRDRAKATPSNLVAVRHQHLAPTNIKTTESP
jgi:hypothetical protein